MVTRADGLGIRPVASTEATLRVASVADARQQSFDQFTSASFGKLFRAEVLSSLTDGSFTVKLEDATTLQMNLPAGTQVGDKLELTLVATQPRPTFSMPQQGSATATSAELSPAGQLIDNLLSTAQSEGAPTTLVGKAALVTSPSATPAQMANALKDTLTYSGLFYESHVGQWTTGARALNELMREPQAKYSDPKLVSAAMQHAAQATGDMAAMPEDAGAAATAKGADATLATARPALAQVQSDAADTPPADVSPIAARLQAATAAAHAVITDASPNGEPGLQNGTPALPNAPAPVANPDDMPAAQATSPAAVSADPDTAISALPISATAPGDAIDGTAPALASATDLTSASAIIDTSAAVPETMQSETSRMVSLQLDTLEHQRIMWRGEVWPGQPMEWEISEDASNGGGNGGGERAWQSTLRVELPSLGTVAATIHLTGQHVQIQMRAANEHTAALLRTHGDKLATAMEAAGSTLDQLIVKQDASA
jgi:hypothetical protein